MLTKNGVNTTTLKKHVRGTPEVEKPKTASSPKGEKHVFVVTCSSCGSRFEKECADEYLCKIMNTKCPKCGGDLE